MNIHLPAILMWTTEVQGFDTLPYLNWAPGIFMSPKHGYSATIEIPKLQEPVVDRGWRLCHVGFFRMDCGIGLKMMTMKDETFDFQF